MDMYEITVTPGTDEKYAAKLDDIRKRYKKRIKEGITALSAAKDLNDVPRAILYKGYGLYQGR